MTIVLLLTKKKKISKEISVNKVNSFTLIAKEISFGLLSLKKYHLAYYMREVISYVIYVMYIKLLCS